MVKNLRIILCVVFVTVSTVLSAQVNEVTLVASGEGQTKTDAVNNALRNAIEQAYGVFVSANTDILNDELVKDEIVTVSSGNIHSYKELGCVDLTDGNKSVSVEAVVSVSNLVNFAQSKGAACEFAGAVFGANLKLINLNKSNGEKAMENLYLTLENVGKTMYDYELEVGQPKANGEVDITVVAKANANYNVFTDLVYNTLKSLSVTNVEQLESMGIKYFNTTIARFNVKNELTFNKVEDRADIGRKWVLTDKISTLFYIEQSVNRIKRIQNEAFLNFNVIDSNTKEYLFNGDMRGCDMNYSYHSDAKDCHSILVEPQVSRSSKYDMVENWSTEIFNYDTCPMTARMFSWVGTKSEYLMVIPDLKVNQMAVKYKKTFTIPVEELMTITGFTIERKN